MKTRSTIILVAAAVALSFAFTAIVTPKAVKAAIATLIRDQDNAARHPFTTLCVSTSTTTISVSCDTPPIPAGEEVVIETVSFRGNADLNNPLLTASIDLQTGGIRNAFSFIVPSSYSPPFAPVYVATQSARFYVDPGSTISCQFTTPNNNPTFPLAAFCLFSGYSVSLP